MQKPVRHAVAKIREPEYGLPVLLAVLVLLVFVLPALGLEGENERLYGSIVTSLMLVTGVVVASAERRALFLVVPAAVATVTVHWAEWFLPPGTLGAVPGFVSIATILLFSVVILAQVVRPGPVTSSRVLGAIAVYLLLGIGWANAYQIVEHFFPGSIVSSSARPASLNDWMYFSFVTLTTVGYGDFVPVHRIARSLAIGEALTGQLYIAVLLARLVSLEISARNPSSG